MYPTRRYGAAGSDRGVRIRSAALDVATLVSVTLAGPIDESGPLAECTNRLQLTAPYLGEPARGRSPV